VRICAGGDQLRVLRLKLLQPLRLVHLQPTVLTTPTVLRLLRDQRFLASLTRRLAVRYTHFHLPQQVHYLLSRVTLPCHIQLLVPSLYDDYCYKSCRADQQESIVDLSPTQIDELIQRLTKVRRVTSKGEN
jgi:hypothetical protein